jgi:hypothetical protein
MNKEVYNIVLIGAKSTGKTVYLTSLYLLPFIRVTDKESLKYLKPLKEQFKNREISATNAGYQELFFEYKKDKFNLRFQIDDYDGKFAEQFSSDENKLLKEKLKKNIKRAEGLLFFLPYEKNLDNQKIDNIREEVDLFIETIKELYPNKKEIPTPVVICVTKWDNSPNFKEINENEKAIEFLENNEILKNVKNKIENFFSNVKIIPISSFNNYNLEQPLEFCFYKTFKAWENRIEEIHNDEFKLLCFLRKIKDDIKFFKDGKYLNLYKTLENKIFKELFNEFKIAKNDKDFENINNKFKLENGEFIIDCLENVHNKEILEIENKLKKNKKRKNIIITVFAIILIFIILSLMIQQKEKKEKDILYTELKTVTKSDNPQKALKLVNEYILKFGKDKKVIEVENEAYKKCKADIDSKKEQLNNFNSLSKKIELANLIENEEKSCNINSFDITTLNKLNNNYHQVTDLINQISMDNIDEEVGTQILNLVNEFKNYLEYQTLYGLLNQKVEAIGDNLLTSNDATDIDNIQKLLNFISQLEINNSQLVEKLNNKYQELQNLLRYNSFKDDLRDKDFSDATQYIKKNYKSSYDSKQDEIQNILQNKFQIYISDIINSSPESINNEENLKILKQKIDAIEDVLDNKVDKINFTPELNNLADKYENMKKLYDKYNAPAIITSISFSANVENNEPLGFKCGGINSDDDIIININEYNYNYKNGSECNELTITWNNVRNEYSEGNYEIKVIEKDPVYDDVYGPKYIELTKDDIINLINGNFVDKNIGNGYSITFYGENE